VDSKGPVYSQAQNQEKGKITISTQMKLHQLQLQGKKDAM
jgi:hypothetical protein